jgi:hypothetical protein
MRQTLGGKTFSRGHGRKSLPGTVGKQQSALSNSNFTTACVPGVIT